MRTVLAVVVISGLIGPGEAAITGGDVHQYQVGAGVALDLPRQFDLVIELMPLGEQSLTLGVGRSI